MPEEKSQAKVNNIDSFLEAVNRGYTKICFNPTEAKDITLTELIYIKRTLFSLGKKVNEHKKTPLIISHLFIDEVQDYSSKHQPNSEIDAIWKRGRRYGIVGIAMSQRPADVSHTILTQSKYHVIFETSGYEYEYFRRYHIPIDAFKGWTAKKYHFAVWDWSTIDQYKPIQI